MTPGQCRAARVLLDWTQDELARRAGISRNPITRFEGGCHVGARVYDDLKRTLEKAGVRFVEDWGVIYREGRPPMSREGESP